MQARTRVFFSILIALQFAAVAFLIICSVTAPTFKQIGLSKYNDVTYGVFGYCTGDGCSTTSAIYSPVDADSDSIDSDWKMSTKARNSLGKILIVTPIAAGLNFLCVVSNSVAFIISALHGASSALLFTINIVLATIAFLASALVCVVIFLLFYPHITWCSWLLIPAAALPLIAIPLIFVAHSDTKNDDVDSDDEDLRGIVEREDVDDNQFDSPNNGDFYKEITANNTTSSLSEKPLVLPNHNYGNFTKQDSMFKINTGTTDQSTMSKEKLDTSDNELDEKNSHTAYSAIRGAQNQQQNKPFSTSISIASSEYSEKNLGQTQLQQRDPRGVLNDIMKDSFTDRDIPGDGKNRSPPSDDGSDFTSISQRAPQQNFYPLPNGSQMGYPPMNRQQRMPQMKRTAGPDSSDLLKNNPNFIAQAPRRMHPPANHVPQQYYPQQQPYNRPMNFNGYPPQNNFKTTQPAPLGPASVSSHYKPAYKKRMNATSIPPASSFAGDNAYGFR